MNFYKHHIGDYDADTSHLSWAEDMAYTRLMRLYYRREQPIPAEIHQACRLVRANSKQEKDAVESVLREFFSLESDGWHNKRCDEEIEAAGKKGDANRSNGVKGGRPRKLETQVEPKNNPLGFDSVSDLTQDEPTENLLQTPDSRLHSPIPPNRSKPDSVNGSHAAVPTDVELVFDHWRAEWGHQTAKLDAKRTKAIREGLKSYTAQQLCIAISGYRKSPHHTGSNDCKTVYDALTLLLRDNDHIDAGIKFASQAEKTTWM